MSRDYTPHFVGLGGTGTDVITSILGNTDFILPLLKTEGVRLSCLALDVASSQIDNLNSVYNDLQQKMRANSISRDKLSVVAKSFKDTKPEGLFDFVRQYPQYSRNQNCTFPDNYRPWLSSITEIPELAGGVGRRRALSKAIYGQNHYVLRVTQDPVSMFLEVVVSTNVPVIFVIYGLGGGSGSGMALDFTRDLKKFIGRGVPIVGVCVLPCSSDDPPAKGAPAFAALIEHGAVLNRITNSSLITKYGEAYTCPYEGFFFIPLALPLRQGKGLKYAQKTMDQALGDILINCLNFDLQDLLGQLRPALDVGDKWVHTLSTVLVSYPIQEYIDLTKSYLEKLNKMMMLKRHKKEIYGGENVAETGGVFRILGSCYAELADIYRKWLIQRGRYEISKFDEVLKDFIYEEHTIDADFVMQITGVHDVIKSEVDELYKPVKAVRLDAHEGTVEHRIGKSLDRLYDDIIELPRKHFEFRAEAPEILIGIREDLEAAVQLTRKQSELLREVAEISEFLLDYLGALRRFMEAKKLADRLYRLLETSEQTEFREQSLAKIKEILNPEMVIISSFISSMFFPLHTEIKNIDEYLTGCRRMRRALDEKLRVAEDLCRQKEEMSLAAEGEKKESEKELSRVNRFFSSGKYRLLQSNLQEIDRRLSSLKEDIGIARAELLKIQMKKKEYEKIAQKYEVNSEYRRLLPEIIEMTDSYYRRQDELARDKGYYERTGELTEGEQLKIMQKILKGEERALSQENILKDILDHKHLRNYLSSVVNLFKAPDALGLTSEYRTELMWFVAWVPEGIWRIEMEEDVKAALASYIKHDVSRSLSIRHIVSGSPWTMRFLLVAARASPYHLREYQELKQAYEYTSPEDKKLAHSFLLEQGLQPGDYLSFDDNIAAELIRAIEKESPKKG
ncbi:MAG: tubulin-like doman-containing protein [Dehalococcoidia bacterium]|nr:tubulin-like doman-containing protein [Dehalococcoidia bacterium]